MRVSRTRFSRRRSKRKTEFPIVAVVQKKRKVVNKPLDNNSDSLKGKNLQGLRNKSPFLGHTNRKFATRTRDIAPSKDNFGETNLSPEGLKNTSNITKQSLSSSTNSLSPTSYGTSRQQVEKNKIGKPQKKSRATIDYKNVILLRNLITAEGKILPRRINKLTAKQQRHIQKAIKSARIMGLIPFINKSRPFS